MNRRLESYARARRQGALSLAGACAAALLVLMGGPARAGELPELLRFAGATDYRAWMARFAWENLRPFSDSTQRFRLENGALRMESRGDSFLIGSTLPGILPVSLDEYPYLRFVVRIERVPEGADVSRERLDDSAFRLYAATRASPPQSVVYAWTWNHPVGHWSHQGLTSLGLFTNVRHKSIGNGAPPAGQWITVETRLREDVRAQFPDLDRPRLVGISLKADSNDTEGASSLAWIRSASLHRESLRAQGLREGDPLGDTVLWYR